MLTHFLNDILDVLDGFPSKKISPVGLSGSRAYEDPSARHASAVLRHWAAGR